MVRSFVYVHSLWKGRIKRKIDERVNSEQQIFQQEITSLKQVNLQIQNKMEELEQYGRNLSVGIDGVPVIRRKKKAKMVLNSMWVHLKMWVLKMLINKAHRAGQTYFDKKSSKKCKSIIL